MARELKYSSGPTDLDRLARELAAERHPGDPVPMVQAGSETEIGPLGGGNDGLDDGNDNADTEDDSVDYRRYSAYDDGDDLPANGTYNR